MTDLPVDEREWGAAFLRKRAELHSSEAAKIQCLAYQLGETNENRAAIMHHETQARALHHEAELIEKAPHDQ